MAAKMGQVREFSLRDSDWSIHKARLEQYFIANEIIEERIQKAVLLNSLDEDGYKLVTDLCVPEVPENKTYPELKQVLDKHFIKPTSIYIERFKFYQATKNVHESVAEWAARVKNLGAKCKFGQALDQVLTDKFIVGFEKGEILDKFFEEEENLTFERAIHVATKKETGRSHIEYSRKVKTEPSTSIFQMAEDQRRRRRRGASAGRQVVPRAGSANVPVHVQSSGRDEMTARTKKCGVCGKYGHMDNYCRYKNYSCDICKKKGHLKSVCRYKFRNNYLDESDNVNSEVKFDQQDVLDDNDSLNLDCLFSLEEQPNDKLIIEVKIDNFPFHFELDTGASVSVISERFKIKHLNKYVLQSTQKLLHNYVGKVISPIRIH